MSLLALKGAAVVSIATYDSVSVITDREYQAAFECRTSAYRVMVREFDRPFQLDWDQDIRDTMRLPEVSY